MVYLVYLTYPIYLSEVWVLVRLHRVKKFSREPF